MTGESMTDEAMAILSPPEHAAARTGALLREAETWLHLAMPRVEIRFDLRGTSAGQARMRNGSSPIIRYNATLLRLHPTEFIVETVPHEELLPRAHALAARIAANPPLAVRYLKEGLRRETWGDYEDLGSWISQTLGVLFRTEDHREGVASFLEKREPVFKGR